MKTIFVLLLLCWWKIPCDAQQVRKITLDSCIQYALQNRFEIKASENSGKQLAAEGKYLRQQQLPSLNGSYNHQMSWGRSLNMEKYEWEDRKNHFGNLSLSSELTLFAGLRLRNQIRESKLNTARNRTEHHKLQNDIRLEIMQNFYEVLATKANRKLYEVFYEMDQKREKRLEILFQSDRVSDPDRKECQAQTLKSETALRNAGKQYKSALLNLKKNMNYTEKEELELSFSDSLVVPIVPPAEVIYKCAVSRLPQVLLQKHDSLILANQLKQARSSFFPTLSLGGTLYSRYQNNQTDPVTGKNYHIWNQIQDNHYKQIGISLSLPIYNRSKFRYQIRMIKTEQINQSLSNNKLLTDIHYEIERIHLEAESRAHNVRLLKEQENVYQEIYASRLIQYEKNKLTLYDLLTAESNWKNVKQELLVESFNLCCYMEIINFYMN